MRHVVNEMEKMALVFLHTSVWNNTDGTFCSLSFSKSKMIHPFIMVHKLNFHII